MKFFFISRRNSIAYQTQSIKKFSQNVFPNEKNNVIEIFKNAKHSQDS